MMMFQLQPDDTFQSAINRILQSTDYNEPITRYLVQVMQTFGVGPTAPPISRSVPSAPTRSKSVSPVFHSRTQTGTRLYPRPRSLCRKGPVTRFCRSRLD